MEKLHNHSGEFTLFRPTGKVIALKQLKQTHNEFYHGELTEDFATHCANEAMHAYWLNYKRSGKKIRKEAFCQKFKEIVNQMLKEL